MRFFVVCTVATSPGTALAIKTTRPSGAIATAFPLAAASLTTKSSKITLLLRLFPMGAKIIIGIDKYELLTYLLKRIQKNEPFELFSVIKVRTMINQPDKIFDSLLVLQYQSGNEKAANLLVKRWHVKLCKQARWYVKDSDKAKDIAQESWTVIFKKIRTLRDPNKFGAWALKITTRIALDSLRKNKKEEENIKEHHHDTSGNSYDNGSNPSDENIGRLKKGIEQLPVNQQKVLHLFYLEEFTIQQISDILHISKGTVKSRLFNAREKLKLILNNRNDEK